MWIDEAALASMSNTEPMRGRPRLYSDPPIQALLGLKTVFRLPLCALQGFAQSLRDLAFATLPVRNYTKDGADGDVFGELLDQIPTNDRLDTVDGDGAYDPKPCHAAIAAHGATPSISPRDGAVHRKAAVPDAARRNEAVDTIARLRRRQWKKGCGYHRRSLAENAMYRFKTLTGSCLWARRIDSQATKVAIRVGVLNRMTKLSSHARSPSASPEIMDEGSISSLSRICATTPPAIAYLDEVPQPFDHGEHVIAASPNFRLVAIFAALNLIDHTIAARALIGEVAGCSDQGRIHDRVAIELEAAGQRNTTDLSEELLAQRVVPEQTPEFEQRRRFGHCLAAQVDPREAAHACAVVQRPVASEVSQVEPVLDEVSPQHALQPVWWAAVAAFRIVHLDLRAKRCSRHSLVLVRYVEKLVVPRTLVLRLEALASIGHHRQRLLLHRRFPFSKHVHRSITAGPRRWWTRSALP